MEIIDKETHNEEAQLQQHQEAVTMAFEEDEEHHGEESSEQQQHSSYNNDNNLNLSPYLKKGSRVEVSSEEEGFKGSWFEARILEPPVKPKSKVKKRRLALIEYANLLQDDGVTPLTEKVDCRFIRPPPSNTQMEVVLELHDVVDAYDRDGWWTGVIAQIDANMYVVAFEDPPHVLHFPRRSLRPHWNWNSESETWSRPTKLKALPFSLDILNQQATFNHQISVHDRRNGEANSHILSRPSKKMKKQHIISEPPLAMLFPSHARFSQSKFLQPSLSEPDSPITPFLETGESGSRMKWSSARKKRSSSNNRRKRQSDNDSTAGKELKTNEGAVQPIDDVEDTSNGLELTHSAVSELEGPADGYRETLNDTPETIDLTASSEENVNAGTVSNLDEQSLSKKFHTPQVVGKPSKDRSNTNFSPPFKSRTLKQTFCLGNFPIMNGDPSNDVRDIEVALEVNNPMTGNILSVQLPFMKNSPLWEAVESLEIYKKFPQNPHFLPLSNCKEVDREGLAIGRMVTFASTVEMALKLKITDPVSSFNVHMESLLDLETYGFDIKPFQSCLLKKRAARVGHEKLEEMSKKAEGQMMEVICEERKIGEEIEELKSKIRHLQEKFAQKEFEVINIGTCKDVVDEMIKKAKHDFEEISDILW